MDMVDALTRATANSTAHTVEEARASLAAIQEAHEPLSRWLSNATWEWMRSKPRVYADWNAMTWGARNALRAADRRVDVLRWQIDRF